MISARISESAASRASAAAADTCAARELDLSNCTRVAMAPASQMSLWLTEFRAKLESALDGGYAGQVFSALLHQGHEFCNNAARSYQHCALVQMRMVSDAFQHLRCQLSRCYGPPWL